MAISARTLAAISKEALTRLLYQMVLIRRFEEKAAEMYARGRIKGFLHLYIGQEAVAVGALSAALPQDYIYATYREHGHALARGLDAGRVMAELFGRATGVSKGRGGSMHLFDVSKRFMGGYAIVGGHLPLACGSALAAQQLKEDAVSIAFLGDGAVNEGVFHEALNLASVWKLPVLFVCENNFYGMGTAMRRVSALAEIHKRAEAYGIRAEQVDGMDVLEVRQHTEEALKYIRSGEGPFFIETITYRFRGHSMADPEFYRNKQEIDHWRSLDPIATFSARLIHSGRLSQEEIDAVVEQVEGEVQKAADFAEESPEPAGDSLMDNVYSEPMGSNGAREAN